MTQKPFIASTLALVLTSTGLSACGFQPVYGDVDTINAPIKILEIEGRIGHRLRQELNRTLRNGLPGVANGAFLTVGVNEDLQRLNLKENVGVSRTTIIGSANYTLRSIEGEILLSGFVSAQTDYDVANSDYGDIALQNDARERVAYLLARRLHEQLTLDASSSRQDAQMADAIAREEAEKRAAAEAAGEPIIEDNVDRIR